MYHFAKDERHVDLLLSGMEKLKISPAVLVCFSGAITSRSGTSAPFFSGVSIARKLNVPVISVADPTLALSHQLTLGWYVGHHGFHDLPFRIAELLDAFAESTGARLILFGGSGGGFASLLVLSLLKTANASAFVWNPQTSISKYAPPSVKRFLEIAFPGTSSLGDLRNWLESTGVIHDLTSHDSLLATTRTILYLQNKTDWHTGSHAVPFLLNFASGETKSAEVVVSGNLIYCEGNWGDGHVTPPERAIELALEQLLLGKAAFDVALALENDHAFQLGTDGKQGNRTKPIDFKDPEGD